MADPMQPREGDRFVCDRGEIRVDRVTDKWICFVQWPGAENVGLPTRMTLHTWIDAALEHGLRAKEPAP